MPISFEVDARRRLVRLGYTGATPNIQAWEAVMTAILQDPRYQPGFGFLIDRRAVPPPDAPFVRATVLFRENHAAELAGARWAVVVSDPANYGMARMGQALGDAQTHVQQRAFTDVDEAEAWLLEPRTEQT
jgi:hypothetical protein